MNLFPISLREGCCISSVTTQQCRARRVARPNSCDGWLSSAPHSHRRALRGPLAFRSSTVINPWSWTRACSVMWRKSRCWLAMCVCRRATAWRAFCHDDCAACGCLTFRCARRNIRSGRRKWRGIGYFLTGIGHQEHRQSEIAADCCGALWQWLRVGLLDAEADIPAARLTLGLSPAS